MHNTSSEASAAQLDALQQQVRQLQQQVREYRQELQAARQVQKRFLPKPHEVLQGLHLDYWMHPASIISGDALDCWSPVEHQVFFYLLDVSGHGAASALITPLLHQWMRYQLALTPDLAVLSAALNEHLLARHADQYLTLVLGRIDLQQQQLSCIVAAHHPSPVLVQADHSIQVLTQQNKPIGLFPRVSYQCQDYDFRPGDRLCLATDGVLEMLNIKQLDERQTAWEQRVADAAADLPRLLQTLSVPGTGSLDDVTLMTLSWCD